MRFGWELAACAALIPMLGCGAPSAPFEEVTEPAGLGGAVPSYDVALADWDGDGRIDLYAPNHASGAVLYSNVGGLHFEDATAGAGMDPTGDQHGVGWGDGDGDGRPDLYVAIGANHGLDIKANRFYHNTGGRFVETAESSGTADPRGRARGVTWIDYDRDGRLDVFVANFATPNVLFHNRGDGTFEERARDAGLANPAAVHVVWTDYDADGWPDVLFCRPNAGARLFHNRGDGTFVDVTQAAGIPRWPPVLGAAFGDVDGDGDLDLVTTGGEDYPIGLSERDGVLAFTRLLSSKAVALFFEGTTHPLLRLVERDRPVSSDDPGLQLEENGPGHWALRWHGVNALNGRTAPKVGQAHFEGVRAWQSRRSTRLFVNRGDGTFVASATLAERGNGQAVVLGDVDDDGDLDVYVVHSGVEGADEPDALYLNDGRGRFVTAAPFAPSEDRNAGAHLVDLDGDGRLDLVLSGGWGTALSRARHRVFRNVSSTGHWLEVVLVGRRSNRVGLGAWVTVETATQRQVRYDTGGGHYSQDLVPVHFGLGAASAATLTIRWPSGIVETRTVPVDRTVEVVESDSSSP